MPQQSIRTAVAAAAMCFVSTFATAQPTTFKADLMGASETPPNDSKGQGSVIADFDPDNKTLNWSITYTDLTGPASAAHFHGPATVGAKAPPVILINGDVTTPIKGSATLTDQQAKDLEAGMWYFNLHTKKYPDGEIRGHLTK